MPKTNLQVIFSGLPRALVVKGKLVKRRASWYKKARQAPIKIQKRADLFVPFLILSKVWYVGARLSFFLGGILKSLVFEF